MLNQELLFLGLLMDRPKHGYEIKCQIQDELAPFIGLEVKSIYYPLKKMEGAGFIKKQIGKEGNWPEKNTYSVTVKGKKRFRELIARSFLSIDRPYFQINLSFYFLKYVDTNEAKRRLKARIVRLNKVRAHLIASLKGGGLISDTLTTIVSHDLELCEAEIRSNTRLMTSL